MAKRMLIDATHPEETRVVVLNGSRLEEFDVESSTKQQVKGNIYLAKVTRVEPSLQAAFVEYGGNRHGFLAFSEIHPDYFRIPVGDRDADGRQPVYPDDETSETVGKPSEEAGVPLETALPEPVAVSEVPAEGEDEPAAEDEPRSLERSSDDSWAAAHGPGVVGEIEAHTQAAPAEVPWASAFGTNAPDDREPVAKAAPSAASAALDEIIVSPEVPVPEETTAPLDETSFDPELVIREEISFGPEETPTRHEEASSIPGEASALHEEASSIPEEASTLHEETSPTHLETPLGAAAELAPIVVPHDPSDGEAGDAEVIETLGGDEFEEAERQRSRAPRHYKIQEVIKRRQIMLVQVTKEERGNKGAALTTYLSLAGRYCVLMPNTARGGGVSRKITSISDRRRLKEILEDLDIPEGMGVIVRTAGAERSKPEIKRDYEYLLRLWNEVRDLTLKSTAPALIYEEGNLIKRSIRDLYARDIDEVLVEGEEGYRTAKAFMKMLMPSHAKRVQPYRDPQIGLLHRFQVESQIDAIHSPIVQLRSGGYVVINQTEALVAIDVNSGRSTRERNIEETAVRTNLEAAEEIARQLRLRDLAGLIVIDFIDMEEHRNQGAVERRLKEALKNDRARIQVGRISPFGLLEMSRQRLRPSLVEASTQPCPHCGGTGFIRSTESTALYVLRSIEEEGMRRRAAEVCVYVPTTVALYILNHKRDSLAQLEARYGIHVLMGQDDELIPPAFRLERLRAYGPSEAPAAIPAPLTQAPELDEEEPEDEAEEAIDAEAHRPEAEADEERGRGRRRRRRRRRHEDEPGSRATTPAARVVEIVEVEASEDPADAVRETGDTHNAEEEEHGDGQRRRRGRRGGRRRGRREDGVERPLDDLSSVATTVEIVATGEDNGQLGPDQDEAAENGPVVAEIEMAWSGAGPTGSNGEATASEIETASLPALAGEPPAPSHSGFSADEAAKPPELLLFAEDAVGHDERAGQGRNGERANAEGLNGEGANAEGLNGEGIAPFSHPAQGLEDGPDTRPAAQHEASPPPIAPGPPTEPEPAEPAQPVQAITEKPANPRKGWWQRLIQS
ncbi:MAG TPA: Rne/Rng family ribonuclease [Stellaceae bacterium]|nr:Rne/Rng family ribonuclease [Stellaceae bacterium]